MGVLRIQEGAGATRHYAMVAFVFGAAELAVDQRTEEHGAQRGQRVTSLVFGV